MVMFSENAVSQKPEGAKTVSPLEWPRGWPRTPASQRYEPPMAQDFEHCRDQLIRELTAFGARNAVISTNVKVDKRGRPFQGGRLGPDQPGAAVRFEKRGEPCHLALDGSQSTAQNLLALSRLVATIKRMEDGGDQNFVEHLLYCLHPLEGTVTARSDEPPLFEGAAEEGEATSDQEMEIEEDDALEEIEAEVITPQDGGQGWWDVLGLSPIAGLAEVDAAYERLRRQAERSENAQALYRLEEARAHARRDLIGDDAS